MSPPLSSVTSVHRRELSQWFAEEVHPHESALRNYLRVRFPSLSDPDDLVQETYLRVLRARESGTANLSRAYLFTVARNVAIDLCRRNQVVSFEGIAEIEQFSVVEGRFNPAEIASYDQEVDLLADAIRDLPRRCREVVTLRKIYGLSHKEIAGRLGVKVNTVNAQITLGIARLRDYMRRHGVDRAPLQ